MKWTTSVILMLLLSACSLAIPQKPAAGTVWHLQPETVTVAEQRKPLAIVVAKPWMASGYDTSHVMVSLGDGERDRLADVVWSDTHVEWIRNYFIEGLQSSGAFSSVTGNQGMHDSLLFLRLYIWDFSIHYPDSAARNAPVLQAKFAVTVTNGRGVRMMDQAIIESRYEVAENRVGPIMAGFNDVMQDVFRQVQTLLLTL